MFLGSPEPIKKWHLSAQAPHRTHISIKRLKDRYFFSRDCIPSRTVFSQFAGSFQSSSEGFHSLALGNSTVLRSLAFAGWQYICSLISTGVSIQSFWGGKRFILDNSLGFAVNLAMSTPYRPVFQPSSF